MVKTIVLLLLAAMSTATMAEWVLVGGNDDIAVYLDPATIRKNGKMVQVWSLVDYRENQEDTRKPHFSTKTQNEFDCAAGRHRTLYLTEHSGNMGKGKVIASGSATAAGWRPIAPDSAVERLANLACGKVALNERPADQKSRGSEADPGQGDWRPIGTTNSGRAYVDASSIRRQGNMVTMALLMDYREPQREEYGTANSMLSVDQYDCSGTRSRGLHMSVHADNMGRGKPLTSTSEPDDWYPIPSGSVTEKAWKIACGKAILDEAPARENAAARDSAAGAKRAGKADWVMVTETDKYIRSADRASINRSGKMASMWVLTDYKQPTENQLTDFAARSAKSQSEFDCSQPQWRTLSFAYFTEPGGRGKSDGVPQLEGAWRPVPPGSDVDDLWKIACGRIRQ